MVRFPSLCVSLSLLTYHTADKFSIAKEKVSYLTPGSFSERHVRIFVRTPAKQELACLAFRAYLRYHRCVSPVSRLRVPLSQLSGAPGSGPGSPLVPRVPLAVPPAAAAAAAAADDDDDGTGSEVELVSSSAKRVRSDLS
jgi:hypothetical protein